MFLEVNGQHLAVDCEGYLTDMQAWEPAAAQAMARADNLELTEDHWAVIHLLREFYAEYKVAPPIRVITRTVAEHLGQEKGTNRYLYELFPYGPGKQACRYAGLPKPSGCM